MLPQKRACALFAFTLREMLWSKKAYSRAATACRLQIPLKKGFIAYWHNFQYILFDSKIASPSLYVRMRFHLKQSNKEKTKHLPQIFRISLSGRSFSQYCRSFRLSHSAFKNEQCPQIQHLTGSFVCLSQQKQQPKLIF